MIPYDRSAFGWRLIFRIHGSAVYRSVLPSLVAVLLYFLFRKYNVDGSGIDEDVLHPYAVGVLVTSSTFLIIFKLNQSYSRYWEACGNTHQFMSKWVDATTHTGMYHMQCDHYADIKPPSFFDYPELNSLSMTRNRERVNIPLIQDDDSSNDEHYNDNTGLRNRKQAQTQTVQSIPDMLAAQRFSGGNSNAPGQSGGSIGSSNKLSGDSKKFSKDYKKQEYRRRSVSKSINYLESSSNKKKKQQQSVRPDTWRNNDPRSNNIANLYNVSSRSVGDIDSGDLESDALYKESVFDALGSEPIPLVGKPKLDGNWGAYYTKNPKQSLSTFVDPYRPDIMDPKGFASIQGGRTPPLFLQELAHLSSLLNAVALATLRNDMEGCESPLAIYEPGQPWPEVDPNNDELIKKKGFQAFVFAIKKFLGVGLSAEQRSKHNAALPLSVIGGVSDAEIRFLQIARGPYAKTQLCFNWLTEFIIREHLAGSLGNVAPPIISRIVQFLGDGMIYYNHARKIMFIPFPFVHAQLSVIFVLFMVAVIPFLMHQYTDEPAVGTILTFLTVLCLSGINEVARDLENPFRNFPNDLPLVTFQAQYNEALITMYAGFHPDFFWNGDQVLRKAQSSLSRIMPELQDNSSDALETVESADDESLISDTNDSKSSPPTAAAAAPSDGGDDEDDDDDATTDVAVLKRQLEEQAKLIQELFARVGRSVEKDDTK